jgi:hypothetical protein
MLVFIAVVSVWVAGFMVTCRILKSASMASTDDLSTYEILFIAAFWPTVLVIGIAIGIPYGLYKLATIGLGPSRHEKTLEKIDKLEKDMHIDNWEDPTW